MSMLPQLVIFDLDGTLTPSKSAMDQEMSKLLQELLTKTDVAVISGGLFSQFEKQFLVNLGVPPELLSRLHLFPTCGSRYFRYDGKWTEVYAHILSSEEKQKIFQAFEYALKSADYEKPDRLFGELIEDRDTQITFSALGQEAPLDLKTKWDPNQEKRLLIKKFLDEKLPDFEVRVAGLTSVDVTKKGIDKEYGVRQMEKHLKISINKMIFVGDALFIGGNDNTALKSGVKGIQTSGPEETKKIIREMLRGEHLDFVN
jgi:phosphomannomutase